MGGASNAWTSHLDLLFLRGGSSSSALGRAREVGEVRGGTWNYVSELIREASIVVIISAATPNMLLYAVLTPMSFSVLHTVPHSLGKHNRSKRVQFFCNLSTRPRYTHCTVYVRTYMYACAVDFAKIEQANLTEEIRTSAGCLQHTSLTHKYMYIADHIHNQNVWCALIMFST